MYWQYSKNSSIEIYHTNTLTEMEMFSSWQHPHHSLHKLSKREFLVQPAKKETVSLTEPLDTALLTLILFCLRQGGDGKFYFMTNTYIWFGQVFNILLKCVLFHCPLAKHICNIKLVQHWNLVQIMACQLLHNTYLPTCWLPIVNYWNLKNQRTNMSEIWANGINLSNAFRSPT